MISWTSGRWSLQQSQTGVLPPMDGGTAKMYALAVSHT